MWIGNSDFEVLQGNSFYMERKHHPFEKYWYAYLPKPPCFWIPYLFFRSIVWSCVFPLKLHVASRDFGAKDDDGWVAFGGFQDEISHFDPPDGTKTWPNFISNCLENIGIRSIFSRDNWKDLVLGPGFQVEGGNGTNSNGNDCFAER